MTKGRRLLKTKVLIRLLPPPPRLASNADCAKVSGLLRCLQSNQSKKREADHEKYSFSRNCPDHCHICTQCVWWRSHIYSRRWECKSASDAGCFPRKRR